MTPRTGKTTVEKVKTVAASGGEGRTWDGKGTRQFSGAMRILGYIRS